MPTTDDRLSDVYGADSPEAIQGIYDDWAARYDAENLANGFVLPGIAAGFAARHVARGAGPVFEAACGTGLVGYHLARLGIGPRVGVDLATEMLAAAARRGVYERLYTHELGTPLPEAAGAYAGAICVGAFGPGHAPPTTLDELARVTRPGGRVIFNVIEGSYVAQGFAAKMSALTEAGAWHEVERSDAFQPFLFIEPELLVRVFVFEVL